MAENEPAQRLAVCLDAALSKAADELAERLGAPVDAAVEPGRLLGHEELAAYHQGECLLVTGSVGGAAAGTIGFLLRRDDAGSLAARAQESGQGELAARGTAPLGEQDTAAVVFALAQIAAAAEAVWAGGPGEAVTWPSEPAALTPRLLDMASGPQEAFEALGGGESLMAVLARLGEPLGVEMLFLASTQVAQELAHAAPEGLVPPQGTTEDTTRQPLPRGTRAANLARLLPLAVTAKVILAKRQMPLRDLVQLTPGHVLDLETRCDQPVELHAGAKLIARGEVVAVDERFGFRVTELTAGAE